MTALVAIGLVCWANLALGGKAIAVSISGFLIGILISITADVIDDRDINDRVHVSQILSTIGAMLVFFSAIFGICVVGAVALYYLF